MMVSGYKRFMLCVAAVAVGLVWIVGCGGGGESEENGSTPTAPTVPAGPGTLHAIICGADHDDYIGLDAAFDLSSVSTWLDAIEGKTGLKQHRIFLRGLAGNLTGNDLSAAISGLQVGANDVIVFFYTGHGAANEYAGGSKWPLLIFIDDEEVDFDSVAEQLKAKSARLTVAMVDCCNNYEWQAKVRAAAPDAQAANYASLFLNSSGYLVASAASPGEFSLGGYDGGMFINQFLASFYDGVQSGSDWYAIMGSASQAISDWDEYGDKTVFHPQYDIDIK